MTVHAQSPLAHRTRQIGHLDIPGGGQVVVRDGYAYVGHMKPPYGTSIIDVRDPKNPRIISQITLPNEDSHTHKVRVVGDVMITNVEENNRHLKRKGGNIPAAEAKLAAALGRAPSDGELATAIGVDVVDIPYLRRVLGESYRDGGFKVWDISDRTKPRELCHVRTHGFGVHRFHADERYAYISTEMEGYVGNILIVYDMADPARPQEVSRWWMPGQHVAGGETPTWRGYSNRLHHAMRCGDELWASVWHAGIRVIDASDIRDLRTVGEYDYHPAIPEPTHTVMPFENMIGGRRYAAAIDEEHVHVRGRLRGFMWILDVTDLSAIKAVSTFTVSELDSPFSGRGGRFGAHQYREKLDSTLVYATWFAGGLRIVDVKNPEEPEEVGYFIPEPHKADGAPQSNDVDVDEEGRIYLLDRDRGFHVLEFDRP
ncbi:LVIVD repeat-containing protein [Faunimonas sp. B44]|uniref:LVIVD repeat-containing protein n=1 Tax=Faunimonas sp. B44 TaxID=3461493 RepID=UPI00404464F9